MKVAFSLDAVEREIVKNTVASDRLHEEAQAALNVLVDILESEKDDDKRTALYWSTLGFLLAKKGRVRN
jgi:hypothetical protein